MDILDAFFEEHTITREEISSKAIEYVFSEFVGTPVKNDMYLFKQRIIEHFQIYSEWYQSQSSIIEDIGLICLLEGEKTYPAKQQHYFFVKFHEYLNFDEYKQCAISMLDRYSVQEYSPHFQFLTSPLLYMERKFIEELSGHLILQGPECFKSPSCQQKNYLHLQEGKSGTSVRLRVCKKLARN